MSLVSFDSSRCLQLAHRDQQPHLRQQRRRRRRRRPANIVGGLLWRELSDCKPLIHERARPAFARAPSAVGRQTPPPPLSPPSPRLHEEGVRNQERERELRRVSTPDNDSLENLSAPLPTFPTSVSAVCALMYLTAAEDGGGKGMKAV